MDTTKTTHTTGANNTGVGRKAGGGREGRQVMGTPQNQTMGLVERLDTVRDPRPQKDAQLKEEGQHKACCLTLMGIHLQHTKSSDDRDTTLQGVGGQSSVLRDTGTKQLHFERTLRGPYIMPRDAL